MPDASITDRLAVCSWSLQPQTPEELFERVKQIGIPRLQIALDPIRDNRLVWGKTQALAEQQGITFVSGMFGTIGEDYTSMESIRRTGGVVPDEHWDANWRNIQEVAKLASSMGLKVVTFHAGFLPHSPSDPDFAKLLARITQIADLFERHGITLGFETGQEDAHTLRLFLEQLKRPNVGVNFDPANMILYAKGDPIEALRVLGPWLKQVHIKDANQTKIPGQWGEEVRVGTGQVDWRAFFKVLNELHFKGWACIEREAGNQRVADIQAASTFVSRL
ncbi:MAG TPA: sugar phosphate isomerase/epimerase family protein [Methylomirabilota bacterium]|nr:sugar phosphate isomerase/epimerase family protein [Methylomirabilota bacterium]